MKPQFLVCWDFNSSVKIFFIISLVISFLPFGLFRSVLPDCQKLTDFLGITIDFCCQRVYAVLLQSLKINKIYFTAQHMFSLGKCSVYTWKQSVFCSRWGSLLLTLIRLDWWCCSNLLYTPWFFLNFSSTYDRQMLKY